MKAESFFQTHPVFRRPEFAAFMASKGGSTNESTLNSLLAHHRSRGRLLQVRRSIYAVVPHGVEPGAFRPDSYLIGAKAWEDGVLGFHTALELHGYGHSSLEVVYVFCHATRRSFEFQGVTYEAVLQPKPLRDSANELTATERLARQGLDIQATSLERAIVDCLARPDYAGGWEELFRSIDGVPYVDLEAMLDYAEMLDNATTVGKLGLLLEAKRNHWFVGNEHLSRLEALAPSHPCYIERDSPSTFVPRWNLMVPDHFPMMSEVDP